MTIENTKDIKHTGLRRFWESNASDTSGIQGDHKKSLRLLLVHLDSAKSLRDIAEGLGQRKRHHKLKGYPHRYSMEVNGNYRITYDCPDNSSGIVKVIDYEDYH
jgi:plasmid maintenance system killer protein